MILIKILKYLVKSLKACAMYFTVYKGQIASYKCVILINMTSLKESAFSLKTHHQQMRRQFATTK